MGKTTAVTMEDIFANEIMEEGYIGLQCALLGPSGSGKSHTCGTLPGPILNLCGSTERHGVKSARKNAGKDLIPICWGQSQDGTSRSPDAAYKFLIATLSNPEALVAKGIKSIVIDSMTDLMNTIKGTQVFENMCATPKGIHDRWAEPDAYMDMVNPILSLLRTLQEQHDINFVVTFDLEIQSQDEKGMIVQSKPRLPSFSVAERLLQQFTDILMISRVQGKEKKNSLIQMGAGCKRESFKSQDEGGGLAKTIDFTPRLGDVTEFPRLIKADFAEILKLKGQV